MKKNQNNILDHDKIADEFTEFQTSEQKHIAREKVKEYLSQLAIEEPVVTSEIIRRINNDHVFKEKMLNSVIQFSCLLTSSLIETIFVFDKVFEVVKRKSKDDYDDVKKFKIYLLDTFSLEDLEKDLGFKFSSDILEQFDERIKQINNYFKAQ